MTITRLPQGTAEGTTPRDGTLPERTVTPLALFDVTQVALERAMSGASLRHQALSNNLANINTPGFKRYDLDFKGVLANALERDPSGVSLDRMQFKFERETNTSVRADGSNVDVEREVSALAENSLEYQALVSVSRARLQMLRQVIAGR